MKKFEDGIQHYTTGSAVVRVHFPEGYVACAYCPYCIKDGRNYLRMVCFLTGEIVPAPEAGRLMAARLRWRRSDLLGFQY